MSTTFEVYPGIPEIPTFRAIIERSTMELHRFLESIHLTARPPIEVHLQACEDNRRLPLFLDQQAVWGRDAYAWFSVGEVPGGTDAYFDDDVNKILEFWDNELENPKYATIESTIRACARVGHYWWFRRSIGQLATTNLAYGLIAGSMASLTNGIVYSMDSAWDWQRMPATADDFLRWYFRPEHALKEDFREWSQQCINRLASELGEKH
jgi:hypothetical protein